MIIEEKNAADSQHFEGPAIVFDDVCIGFEGNQVLDHVSFKVEQGETRILLGPAGGGKSVLLKLCDGLLRPDSGKIFVLGKEITAMRERDLFALRHRIGMVFQESALFDSMSVEDNVAYLLHEERVPEEEVRKRVEEALAFVELSAAIDKFPSELSGGMRRRVSIARAIITQPDLILYDSPTGGLDPITSTTIIELVIRQRDEIGTTSVMITHRLQDAFMLATHCYNSASKKVENISGGGVDKTTKFLVLNEGKVVFDGTTQELTHSDDPWIKDYLA
ncbi:MAG: ATP-binding cassette domain-containing protein [Acidobacteria bacterium]|nr:ATP-binding cassette domain-containing protein [Acidobacteriota bacterium]